MHRRLTLALALVVLVTSASGCSATVAPPVDVQRPVDVFLTDYGRHSSVLLPTPADQNKTYTEYAFGDYRWFALGDTKWYVAVGSMISSGGATLGRRHVVRPNPGSSDDEIEFAKKLDCAKLIRIQCDSDRVAAVARKLDERFNHDANRFGGTIHSNYSG